jgi:prolyl-tRNA synthetase
MKYSKIFGKTSKTEGTDLVVDSHKLLIQAGFVRESRAGRYFFLPLGLNVHNKIISLVRKHMSEIGAQEMVTPVLHPRELWAETNRTSAAGFELMGIKDRRGADFVLGGTAEEMMVDVVRKFNISYRDLPFDIYQFSMKFRDEMRASGGLLRVREFVMKDAYSFSTEDQFKEVYQKYWDAYKNIFDELKLETDVVKADNGYIGGEYCHEFVTPAEVGESTYFVDEQSGYAAHEDVAVFDKKVDYQYNQEQKTLQKVPAERGTTMQDGVKLHGFDLPQHIKNVVYKTSDNRIILACIRGDLDVNETKLLAALPDRDMAGEIQPLTEEEIVSELGSVAGFISAVGIRECFESAQSIKSEKEKYRLVIVADDSIPTIINAASGANEQFQDYSNINYQRDFTADIVVDIALAKAEFKSQDGGVLVQKKGIEVGNIFQLGYHYTNLMKGCDFTDEDGQQKPLYMGCYGIGIGRTLAAVVEAHHDEKGIIWPESIAPYKYHIVTIARTNDDESYKKSQEIYQKLIDRGEEVLWDDRLDIRPGEKFADADLIGCPVRLVVSPKTLQSNTVEMKARADADAEFIEIDKL